MHNLKPEINDETTYTWKNWPLGNNHRIAASIIVRGEASWQNAYASYVCNHLIRGLWYIWILKYKRFLNDILKVI